MMITALHDEHLFMSHTFKDCVPLSLAQWKTILEGMPDTVLRAKGIVPTTEGPSTNSNTALITVRFHLVGTNDYSLVVIGTDFNVPMVHNEVCQS